MKRLLALLAIAGLVASATAVQAAEDRTENIDPIARIAYKGGSHLAFGNGLAYGGEINGESGRDQAGFEDKGGIRIFDISGKTRQLGFLPCPGNDMDVSYVKPGLIVVGFHKASCAGAGEGVFTLDVSNPTKPKILGKHLFTDPLHRVHAIARYPGKPLIYTAGGGLGRGQETVTFIDVSNPREPKVAGEFIPPPRGCHDLSFHQDKRGTFMICSGLGDTSIWNVDDPLSPQHVADIVNPLIQFQHYAVASADGKLLVINDENITVNDCVEQETPTGAIWVYDISQIDRPTFLSYHSPRRGGGEPFGTFWGPESTAGTCTSHDFNWIDNRTVVIPWYSGGFSVISLKDPSAPEEIAWYQPKGTNMWSAHWYKGRIYTNDMGRGFEVLELDR